MSDEQPIRSDERPVVPKPPSDEVDRLGGDPPCWEHLLDDDGRMPEPARGTGED